MTLILHIEVSGKTGFVSIAVNGIVKDTIINENQMEHASFLQPAINQILGRSGFSIKNLDAIALSNGPGSYTGLRVGMASAKGLAFALNIPLIAINTLKLMATSVRMRVAGENSINFVNKIIHAPYEIGYEPLLQNTGSTGLGGKEFLTCPLVDARRMDVFFGLFDAENIEVIPVCSATIGVDFLHEHLKTKPIIFSGSGAAKLQKIITHPNAYFAAQPLWDKAFGQFGYIYYKEKKYSDIAHAEPFYCKEFYDAAAPGS